MIDETLLSILVCPSDRGPLSLVDKGNEVLLYVDDANTAALALYEKYGFARADHDAQYRAPRPS